MEPVIEIDEWKPIIHNIRIFKSNTPNKKYYKYPCKALSSYTHTLTHSHTYTDTE